MLSFIRKITNNVKNFLFGKDYEAQLNEKIDALTETAASARQDRDQKAYDEAMALCYLFQLELEDVVRTKRQFEDEADRAKRQQRRQNAIRKAQKFSRRMG